MGFPADPENRIQRLDLIPSLVLQTFLHARTQGRKTETVFSAGKLRVRVLDTEESIEIPIDEDLQCIVELAEGNELNPYPYDRVYEKRSDQEFMESFRDKIVLIGPEKNDEHSVGEDTTLRGVEIQASAVSNLLQGIHITSLRPLPQFLVIPRDRSGRCLASALAGRLDREASLPGAHRRQCPLRASFRQRDADTTQPDLGLVDLLRLPICGLPAAESCSRFQLSRLRFVPDLLDCRCTEETIFEPGIRRDWLGSGKPRRRGWFVKERRMQLKLPPVLRGRGHDKAPIRPYRGMLAILLVLASTVPAWGLQSSDDFVARIKSIVELTQSQAEVQVIRSQNRETLEGEAGLGLFSGDQIRTGDGTQVVIFFLSDAEGNQGDNDRCQFADADRG